MSPNGVTRCYDQDVSKVVNPVLAHLPTQHTTDVAPGVLLHTAVDFGLCLRACRENAGITQAELAAKVGVSCKWVSETENGKSTVELGRVIAVFAHLGLVLRAEPAPTQTFDIDAYLNALTSD